MEGKEIKRMIDSTGVKYKVFAKHMGISPSCLSNYFNHKQIPLRVINNFKYVYEQFKKI